MGLPIFLAVVLTAPLPASAAAVECGQVITSSITLQEDLTCATGDGLVVGAANVQIDLNGHQILVEGSDGNPAVGVRNAGYPRLSIQNGRVLSFDAGPAILITGAVNNKVTDVEAWGWIEAGVKVVDSSRILLRGNDLDGDSRGLWMVNTSDSVIRDSKLAASNFGSAAVITGDRNRLTGNEITNSGDSRGLVLTGNQNAVIDNTIHSNDPHGATIAGNGNVVRRNVVSANGTPTSPGYGVQITGEGGLVDGNQLNANFGDGLRVTGSIIVRNNVANDNTGWGILAAAGAHDGGGNTATGNLAGQCSNISCS
ncbi:MAG: right-handed parallel beta-helix repeat-containing protein [Actinomycetota bacterium]